MYRVVEKLAASAQMASSDSHALHTQKGHLQEHDTPKGLPTL